MTIDASIAQVEQELNAFLDKRAAGVKEARPGQDAANLEAQRQRDEDRHKLEEMYREHRVLWISHYRRLAFASLQNSRDYRRRARALETDG